MMPYTCKLICMITSLILLMITLSILYYHTNYSLIQYVDDYISRINADIYEFKCVLCTDGSILYNKPIITNNYFNKYISDNCEDLPPLVLVADMGFEYNNDVKIFSVNLDRYFTVKECETTINDEFINKNVNKIIIYYDSYHNVVHLTTKKIHEKDIIVYTLCILFSIVLSIILIISLLVPSHNSAELMCCM
jgi:hypothetical protein